MGRIATAFSLLLIFALVPAVGVVHSPAPSQSSLTITAQVTTTELYTLPIVTQYVTSTATTYFYGPEAFTIQAATLTFCYNSRVNFTATQGQQFHFQWTTAAQIPPLALDFYVATQSAFSETWYCDTGPTSLYSKSGAFGSVDWVAPSAGQYVALLVNNNPSAVSGTSSIETSAINTATSISYATATSTKLVALTIETSAPPQMLTVLEGMFPLIFIFLIFFVVTIIIAFLLNRRRRPMEKLENQTAVPPVCVNCGAKLIQNARFCKECGTPVD